MRIQLLSDVHNEFYRHGGAPDIADSDADVVILAGDIDVGVHGLTWAISFFRYLQPIQNMQDGIMEQLFYSSSTHLELASTFGG